MGQLYFEQRAWRVVRAHATQTMETVRAMHTRWHGRQLLAGRVHPWDVLQRLALAVDHSDVKLGTTSQWIHTLQVCVTRVIMLLPPPARLPRLYAPAVEFASIESHECRCTRG